MSASNDSADLEDSASTLRHQASIPSIGDSDEFRRCSTDVAAEVPHG